MQFGQLSNRQAIDNRFKQLRVISRQQLLNQIYNTTTTNTTKINQESLQKDLAQAFTAIINNYDLDKNNQVVKQISFMFGINLQNVKQMNSQQRQKYLYNKIYQDIESKFNNLTKINNHLQHAQNIKNSDKKMKREDNHFQWLGVKSKYTQLRPIFQQIILEKVKLFDSELSKLTNYTLDIQNNNSYLQTTARGGLQKSKSVFIRPQMHQQIMMNNKIHKQIQSQFCNVKIRDKSQFLLQKWTKKEESQFKNKKSVFKSNLKINNIPVLFQFVKKYTETVKARDNIYQKWQNRQQLGITPQELKYLCATSLFLNKTLAKSQKQRIKNNISSAGSNLISKLQANIAEKIIETYHQLIKKISDLRAKYYEQVTLQRKQEQREGFKTQQSEVKQIKKKEFYLKYKLMFEKILSSQRMKIKLNKRIYKWVQLFIKKLKQSINKSSTTQNAKTNELFLRLAKNNEDKSLIHKLKVKYPSGKIIKREDPYSHRLKYRTYLPSQRFHYQKPFQDSIAKLNKIKLNKNFRGNYSKQLSGGPKKQQKYIIVNLNRKQIYMSSPSVVKYVIAIQAKWKCIFYRNKYKTLIDQLRQNRLQIFKQKILSLKRIYPPNKKINMKLIQNRLRRVNMKISNIVKPYIRVNRRPINMYTSFTINQLSLADLKNKYARNGQIRLGQFIKMVQNNQYYHLKKCGIVVTNKEINDIKMSNNANAMWWAVYHSNLELVKIFLEGGGDPNSKDNEENTCLHIAIKNGDIQIIFILLDYGADLNKRNSKKVTCLYNASKKMQKLLGLQEGVIIGEKDNNSIFYKKNNPYEDIYTDHY